MATRKPAANKIDDVLKRLAALEEQNKALRAQAAKRDADDGEKDDDKDEERESEEKDEERDADKDKDGGERDGGDDDDDDSDSERAAEDDDAEDDKKGDERGARKGGKRGKDARFALTEAEVRKLVSDGITTDRKRSGEIHAIGAQFSYPKAAENAVARGLSVQAFKDDILERLAARQQKSGDRSFGGVATPGVDEDAPTARSMIPGSARPVDGRAFAKGAEEARALLGLKAA